MFSLFIQISVERRGSSLRTVTSSLLQLKNLSRADHGSVAFIIIIIVISYSIIIITITITIIIIIPPRCLNAWPKASPPRATSSKLKSPLPSSVS